MTRSKIAILVGSPQKFDLLAFKYFILSLNKAQAFFEFCFPVQYEFPFVKERYSESDLDQQYQKLKPEIKNAYDYVIIIGTAEIEDDLFYIAGTSYSFITTAGWDRNFAPPSVFDYLVNSIVGCLIYVKTDLELESHDETTFGCVLDYVEIKEENRVGIVTGGICDNHKREIAKLTSKEFLRDMETLLSRKWVGQIEEFDSVAFNLKKHFSFDIYRDSGFKKTWTERLRESLHELPGEAVSKVALTILGSLLTALLVYLGMAASGE